MYGPQGNVARKTVNSVKLLAEAHTNLIKTVSSINQEYLPKINVNTLSTDHIECLHFSHRNRSVPTVLEHSRDLGSTLRENCKKTTGAGFYYHTHSNQKEHYFPSTHDSCDKPIAAFNMIKFPPQQKVKLSKEHQQTMIERAREHGKPVRQRSARQQTTKKNAGTLPLSM